MDWEGEVAATGRVLNALTMRAKVIAHNIANQNTPGFKRFRVLFEERLRAASAAGESPASVEPQVVRDTSGAPGTNNVEVMSELTELEKVRLLFDVFSRRIGGSFTHLNKAIFGRP